MQKATNVIETWVTYLRQSSVILLLPGASVKSEEFPDSTGLTILGYAQIYALSSILQANQDFSRLLRQKCKFLCGAQPAAISTVMEIFKIDIDRVSTEERWVSRGVIPSTGYRKYEANYPVVHCDIPDILRIMLRVSGAQHIWDEWNPQNPLDTIFIERTEKGALNALVALSTLEDPSFQGLGP